MIYTNLDLLLQEHDPIEAKRLAQLIAGGLSDLADSRDFLALGNAVHEINDCLSGNCTAVTAMACLFSEDLGL